MASFDLQDKVVLITGASSGIGRACAKEFHRTGARVVAAARSLDKLETLSGELGGERILSVQLDLTADDQRQSALEATCEAFGPVDVLVNNAGWASFGTVQRTPLEHFDRMIATNFTAAVAMIQLVLPEMIAHGSGQIINISSILGVQPIPRKTVYSATKAAMNALTTGLRMELKGSGVDVLLVAPSSTRTDFFKQAAMVDTGIVHFANTQCSPERVARAVVRSSRRRRKFITLSTGGKAISLIRRLSPSFADTIMYHIAKRTIPLLEARKLENRD